MLFLLVENTGIEPVTSCMPYGTHIKVFGQTIPHSVRAAEISAAGKSIFVHDPKGKVAEAYKSLTKEVLADAEKQRKRQSEQLR